MHLFNTLKIHLRAQADVGRGQGRWQYKPDMTRDKCCVIQNVSPRVKFLETSRYSPDEVLRRHFKDITSDQLYKLRK